MAKAKASTKSAEPAKDDTLPKSPFESVIVPKPTPGPARVYAGSTEWLAALQTDAKFAKNIVDALRAREHLDDDPEISATTELVIKPDHAAFLIQVAPAAGNAKPEANDYRSFLLRGETPFYNIFVDRKEDEQNVSACWAHYQCEVEMSDGRWADVFCHSVVRIPMPFSPGCPLPPKDEVIRAVESCNSRLKDGVTDVLINVHL